ncbi:MAG: 1-deoxy-D-xylulose-5-phosphate reductoisomerase, partial [Oscillospiraceae bacterium]|nr:1-deoxy-D-xylulose-5-phosphate reductoisomerase [Oscillospiraceae bacterium]
MMKIAVLGSTGSIGRQTLDVAEGIGAEISALTANRSAGLLEEQARKFNPEIVAVADESAAADLRVKLSDTDIRVLSGPEGLCEAAAGTAAGCVVTAVMGTAGLLPTMAAIKAGKRIALANKETLVCAGSIVMKAVDEYNTELLPVDSEHSAIFQCLMSGRREELRRIILTGSGGPFRGKKREELSKVRPEDALKHPNWSMGPKITIDSATLMNKGLEFIEAMHLFRVSPDDITVLVHPQSIIHS